MSAIVGNILKAIIYGYEKSILSIFTQLQLLIVVEDEDSCGESS
jgi:hypothetical protein